MIILHVQQALDNASGFKLYIQGLHMQGLCRVLICLIMAPYVSIVLEYTAIYLNIRQYASKCPAGNYMFKVNNGNTRTRCEICSKLTIKTPERRQWRRSGVFIVNFEHISHLVLVFLLLTLSR